MLSAAFLLLLGTRLPINCGLPTAEQGAQGMRYTMKEAPPARQPTAACGAMREEEEKQGRELCAHATGRSKQTCEDNSLNSIPCRVVALRGECSVAEVRAQKNGRNQLKCCPLLTKTRGGEDQQGPGWEPTGGDPRGLSLSNRMQLDFQRLPLSLDC